MIERRKDGRENKCYFWRGLSPIYFSFKNSEGEIAFNTDDGASVIKIPFTNKETEET